MTDALGPLIDRFHVEHAVLDTLRKPPVDGGKPRIAYYLADVERQRGLKARSLPLPPAEESYRGGMDFETFKEDQFPLLIAVVKPDGPPIPLDTLRTYGQGFSVQVAATVDAETEDEARALADRYGIAVAGAILAHGSLGIGATNTSLTGFPDPEFPDVDMRAIIRSIVTFTTYIAPVIDGSATPWSWSTDPYQIPSDWPEIKETNVTVQAEPIGQ